MKNEIKLIDDIITEIRDKNILGDVAQISVTKPGLEKLKAEYGEEFINELKESGRAVSMRDLEDYFGIPIVVSNITDEGKEYQLLTKI